MRAMYLVADSSVVVLYFPPHKLKFEELHRDVHKFSVGVPQLESSQLNTASASVACIAMPGGGGPCNRIYGVHADAHLP